MERRAWLGSVLTTITFFAANNLTLGVSGRFWSAGVAQTVKAVDGLTATTEVAASKVGHTLVMVLGEHATFVRKKSASSMKSDDDGRGAAAQVYRTGTICAAANSGNKQVADRTRVAQTSRRAVQPVNLVRCEDKGATSETAFRADLTGAVQRGSIFVRFNVKAAAIMAKAGYPTVDLHSAVTGKCGAVPQASCFNMIVRLLLPALRRVAGCRAATGLRQAPSSLHII